jgi:hypothetical protein
MGTNFYARIIPKADEKQKLIDAINSDDFKLVEELTQKFYGSRNEYDGGGRNIHLGKRSCGWKFLWNPNVVKVWNSEECDYQWDYVYPLTKQGIIGFVMRDDVIISDEYDEVLDPEEFLDMAFNWCTDGLDSKEYQTNPKYASSRGTYYLDHEINNFWRALGYEPEYYDFYSDGLRFSTSIEFS